MVHTVTNEFKLRQCYCRFIVVFQKMEQKSVSERRNIDDAIDELRHVRRLLNDTYLSSTYVDELLEKWLDHTHPDFDETEFYQMAKDIERVHRMISSRVREEVEIKGGYLPDSYQQIMDSLDGVDRVLTHLHGMAPILLQSSAVRFRAIQTIAYTKEQRQIGQAIEDAENSTLAALHPEIVASCGKLFVDGHYRQAIFEGCLAVNHAVRTKSGSSAEDGTKLMEHVFSSKNPQLRVSDVEDERVGIMWLFKGAWMGLRNPRGHRLGTDANMSRQECLEWLGFLSALVRTVDNSREDTSLFVKP